LLFLSSAQAQTPNPDVITPKFVPAQPRTVSGVVPASHTYRAGHPVSAALPGTDMSGLSLVEGEESYVRGELPGPQRLFTRDSETQFFDRIRLEMKKQPGGRAIFPDDPIISKEAPKPRKFALRPVLVEPTYVCHGRLYFEQPNFERTGYDLGVLQPAVGLGVFYYDAFLLPYHIWTDLHDRWECSAGKCLPGDPAPMLLPCPRFSVTGLLGQSGTLIGFGFLFP
jgi:hypothetical protein